MLPLPGAFRAWRRERGWSQKELANRASAIARAERPMDPDARVSLSTVAMVELGERDPSADVLGWLAGALGVGVDVLAVVCKPGAEPCPYCRGKAFLERTEVA